MTCKCGCNDIASLAMKHNDMSSVYIPSMDVDYRGYMLHLNSAIRAGSTTNFSVCLACGQIQGWTPVTKETVLNTLRGNF